MASVEIPPLHAEEEDVPPPPPEDDEEARTRWTTASIVLNVVDDVSAHPRTSTAVNIAQYIGTKRGSRGPTGQRIYLADFDDNGNSYREKVLVPAVNHACRSDGFYAISKGYENHRKRLRIICNRGKLHKPIKPSRSKDSRRGTGQSQDPAVRDADTSTTDPAMDWGGSDVSHDGNGASDEDSHAEDNHNHNNDDGDRGAALRSAGIQAAAAAATPGAAQRRPHKVLRTNRPLCREDTCTFQLPLFWDDDVKLWYVHERSAGCLTHRGHRRKPPADIKVKRTHADMSVVLQGLAHWNETLPTIPPPTHAQLLSIQANIIDTNSQRDALQPTFQNIADKCTTAGAYYVCEEWLKALEAKLEGMKSGGGGNNAGGETAAAPAAAATVATASQSSPVSTTFVAAASSGPAVV